MKQIRKLKPGDPQISAADYNALADEVMRLGKMTGDGVQVTSGAGGVHIQTNPPRPAFWARLVAEYDGAPGVYSWIEQERSYLGTFSDLQYGRYDDGLSPALEANLTPGLPTDATAGEGLGAYVWLELGYGLPVTGGVLQEWIFRHAAGSEKVRPVFVTDSTPTSGRYAARIDRRDENTPEWLAVDPLQFVWAIGYNEEALTANARYKGLLVSVNPADGVPVYAVQPAGGGGGGQSVVEVIQRDADGYYSARLLLDFDPATKQFGRSELIKVVNLADTSGPP